jgi:hypothetical protein
MPTAEKSERRDERVGLACVSKSPQKKKKKKKKRKVDWHAVQNSESRNWARANKSRHSCGTERCRHTNTRLVCCLERAWVFIGVYALPSGASSNTNSIVQAIILFNLCSADDPHRILCGWVEAGGKEEKSPCNQRPSILDLCEPSPACVPQQIEYLPCRVRLDVIDHVQPPDRAARKTSVLMRGTTCKIKKYFEAGKDSSEQAGLSLLVPNCNMGPAIRQTRRPSTVSSFQFPILRNARSWGYHPREVSSPSRATYWKIPSPPFVPPF